MAASTDYKVEIPTSEQLSDCLKRSELSGFPKLVYYDAFRDNEGKIVFIINPKGNFALSLDNCKPL